MVLSVIGSAARAVCIGDCNGNGSVTVDEILAMVNVALGNALVSTCEAGDPNHDSTITVDEILTAVNNALNGCPAPPTLTASATSAPPSTATPTVLTTRSATPAPPSPTPTAVVPSPTATSAGGELPPDPATAAPPLPQSAVTDFGTATTFIYTGTTPIQTGVAAGTIVPRRAAVIRGRVLDQAMQPLAAVRISILGHAEYGQTLSRADGMFDLAVNGGGKLIVRYVRAGFFEVQRDVQVPWQDFVYAPDVVLTVPDATATVIDLAAAVPMQVARGSVVSDGSGVRQATLLFPQGTQATFRLPDGTTQPAPAPLTIRQTEYTVGATGPQAMPSELPPSSGYTYYLELSADEEQAAGAVGVEFNQPVIFYLENFLDFPVGENTPVGFYDRQAGNWQGEPDGRVVKIVAINAGAADLDTDGNGSADNGVGTGLSGADLGITLAERQTLATLYAVGQTLWRVTTQHFSPGDINWPYGPPADAIPPNGDKPKNGGEPDIPCEECDKLAKGSIIEIPNQTLGEEIPVVGTGMALNYRSDRTRGRRASYRIDIPVTGATVPASLLNATVQVQVAGQEHRYTFGPGAAQNLSFEWDGKDGYGRTVTGGQIARVRIGFRYVAVYQASAADYFRSWGLARGNPFAAVAAGRGFADIFRDYEVAIGAWDGRANGLGGWSLSAHHAYDPLAKVLYLGNGERRREIDALGPIIDTAAGNGNVGTPVDGGIAKEQPLWMQFQIPLVPAPDGSVYFVNTTPSHKVFRWDPDGTLHHVAGSNSQYDPRTGVPARNAYLGVVRAIALGPDGSLYVAEYDDHTIERIRPNDGVIERFAGTAGVAGFAGDGGPAAAAKLAYPNGLAITPDGSVFVHEYGNKRIRRIGPDGFIATVAGNGNTCTGSASDPGCVSGQPATTQAIGAAFGTIVAGPDGSVYGGRESGISLSSNIEIFRVGPDGMLTVVAGKRDLPQSFAEGVPALNAFMTFTQGLTLHPDGSLWFTTVTGFGAKTLVRRIDPLTQTVRTIAGAATGFGGDGGPALAANLSVAMGLAFTPDGTLFVTDFNNHRIRRLGARFPGWVGVADYLIPAEDGSAVYRFDSNGRHLSTLHPLTGVTLLSFGYDALGWLTSITDGDGNVTTISRDAAHVPTAITAPFGQQTDLSLDPNGYLTTVRNPAGETYALAHESNGLLTSMTMPKGQNYNFAYDGATGYLLVDNDPAGGSQNLARTELPQSAILREGHRTTITTALGRTRSNQVEHLWTGERVETAIGTDGLTSTATIRPDATMSTTSPTGTTGAGTDTADPRWGMLAPVIGSNTLKMPSGKTLALTQATTVALADPANLFSITSLTQSATLNGRTFTSAYDGPTRQFTDTTAAGRVETTTIDLQGRPTAGQFGGLAPAAASYDGFGRLATVTVGTGGEARIATYAYDAQSYLQSVTDPLGRVTSFTYDAAGRPLTQTLPDGRVLTVAYDTNGNVTSVTPPGRPAHAFGYSPVDLETTYDPPNVAGLPIDQTTAAYNVDRQATNVTLPDGKTIVPTYDSAGRVSAVAFSRGAFGVTFSPTTGLPTNLTAPDAFAHAFTYDGTLLTQHAVTGPVTGTLAWTYDTDFRITGQTINGANSVALTYDADSLLTQAGALTLARNAANGLVTGTTLGTVTDTISYNTHAEPLDHQVSAGASPVYRTQFTRDALGRITSKVETINGAADTYDYTYDLAGRLIGVLKNGVTNSTYTYDTNSNRTSYTGPLGDVPPAQVMVDAQDRMTQYGPATFAYNANGDLVSKTDGANVTQYTYDEFGNLIEVILPSGDVIDYLIDGLNRRVGKKVNGTLVKRWLYDGQLRIVAELDDAGSVDKRFVYASRVNVPEYYTQGGNTFRIVTDYLGSPRLVINTATNAIVAQMNHDEYGRVTRDTNPGLIPYGYAGGHHDPETGLVRFGQRDYDPGVGRWLAKEPLRFAGGSNFYTYADADPANFADPSAFEPIRIIGPWTSGVVIRPPFYERQGQIIWSDHGPAFDEMPQEGLVDVSVDVAMLFMPVPKIGALGLNGARAAWAVRLAKLQRWRLIQQAAKAVDYCATLGAESLRLLAQELAKTAEGRALKRMMEKLIMAQLNHGKVPPGQTNKLLTIHHFLQIFGR